MLDSIRVNNKERKSMKQIEDLRNRAGALKNEIISLIVAKLKTLGWKTINLKYFVDEFFVSCCTILWGDGDMAYNCSPDKITLTKKGFTVKLESDDDFYFTEKVEANAFHIDELLNLLDIVNDVYDIISDSKNKDEIDWSDAVK